MSKKNEKEIDTAVEKANETNLIIRIFVWAMMLIILGCFIYSMYESDVKYKQAKTEYISSGYNIVDVGCWNTYAIDDENVNAYISGEKKIVVHTLPGKKTKVLNTGGISGFTIEEEGKKER